MSLFNNINFNILEFRHLSVRERIRERLRERLRERILDVMFFTISVQNHFFIKGLVSTRLFEPKMNTLVFTKFFRISRFVLDIFTRMTSPLRL
jgi:hypothetical protein